MGKKLQNQKKQVWNPFAPKRTLYHHDRHCTVSLVTFSKVKFNRNFVYYIDYLFYIFQVLQCTLPVLFG